MLDNFKNIVIKIGSTSIIDPKTRSLKSKWIDDLCKDIAKIHKKKKEFLKEYNIVIDYNLNLENDSQTSSVDSNYIKLVIENMLKKESVDVFIIGCSAFNVTSYGYITELEEKFGCNFITSNQALLWYTLHKAIGNERPEDIKQGLDKLKNIQEDRFVFAGCKYNSPIQRALKINESGSTKMINPEYFNTRTQDLEDTYYDIGQFYWGRPNAWLSSRNIFEGGHIHFLKSALVSDIDTEEDWNKAEYIHKYITENS